MRILLVREYIRADRTLDAAADIAHADAVVAEGARYRDYCGDLLLLIAQHLVLYLRKKIFGYIYDRKVVFGKLSYRFCGGLCVIRLKNRKSQRRKAFYAVGISDYAYLFQQGHSLLDVMRRNAYTARMRAFICESVSSVRLPDIMIRTVLSSASFLMMYAASGAAVKLRYFALET